MIDDSAPSYWVPGRVDHTVAAVVGDVAGVAVEERKGTDDSGQGMGCWESTWWLFVSEGRSETTY